MNEETKHTLQRLAEKVCEAIGDSVEIKSTKPRAVASAFYPFIKAALNQEGDGRETVYSVRLKWTSKPIGSAHLDDWTAEPTPTVYRGLLETLNHVASRAYLLHGESLPDSFSEAACRKRLPAIRVSLSRGGGAAPINWTYEADGREWIMRAWIATGYPVSGNVAALIHSDRDKLEGSPFADCKPC